jgi:hypothetical protein
MMVSVINVTNTSTTTSSSLVVTSNSSSIITTNTSNISKSSSTAAAAFSASNSLILPQPYINTSSKFAKLAHQHRAAVGLSDLGEKGHTKPPSANTSGLASSVVTSPSSTASSYSSSSSLSSSQTSLVQSTTTTHTPQIIDSSTNHTKLFIESHHHADAFAQSTTIMLAQELINYKNSVNHDHDHQQEHGCSNIKFIKTTAPNLTALNPSAGFKTSIRFKKVINCSPPTKTRPSICSPLFLFLNHILFFKITQIKHSFFFSPLSKGDHIWLDAKDRNDFDISIGGRIINSNSNHIIIVDDEGKVSQFF